VLEKSLQLQKECKTYHKNGKEKEKILRGGDIQK
jgi:hypothetical protein